MDIVNRKIELCLDCMEDHVVYYVKIKDYFGEYFCKYCYRTDGLVQELR